MGPQAAQRSVGEGLRMMEMGFFDSAAKFFDTALLQDPSCVEAYVYGGQCLLETGHTDKALFAFQRAVQLAPEKAPLAYLNMAQMSTGKDALMYYELAIEALQRSLASGGDPSELTAELSQAQCAVAELFLTDLCYDPEAEVRCEQVLNACLQNDPSCAEAMQLLASVRLSQQRPDEARPLLTQSFAVWRDADDESLPPYAARASLAEMLLEVAAPEPAVEILLRLVTEVDTIAEVWYLLSLAHYQAQQFTEAEDCSATALELLQSLPEEEKDAALLKKITDLHTEILSKIPSPSSPAEFEEE